MSYDLHVYGRSGDALAALARAPGPLPHELVEGGATVHDDRSGGVLSVDGPLEVERADVPQEAAAGAPRRALDAQLQRDAGVSLFSYLIMARLSEVPGRTLKMSQLAAITHGSLSKLSHAVRSLERHGWVRRQPSSEGRSTAATLTGAGYEQLVRAALGTSPPCATPC